MSNKSTQVKNGGDGHPTVPAQHPFRSLRDQIDRLMDEFDRALFPSRWMEITPFSKLTSEICGHAEHSLSDIQWAMLVGFGSWLRENASARCQVVAVIGVWEFSTRTGTTGI